VGWFRETQVEKLIKADEEHAAGRMSDGAFNQIVESSTTREIDEALPGYRYDDYDE
jgi:hypothetical protein